MAFKPKLTIIAHPPLVLLTLSGSSNTDNGAAIDADARQIRKQLETPHSHGMPGQGRGCF